MTTTTEKNLQTLFQVTEVELVYHNKTRREDRPYISGAPDAFEIFINSWDFNKIELLEQFKIMLLDQSNRCLGVSLVAQGGISACLVDPRIVFSTALTAKASSIILAHNHPSGNLVLSGADENITRQLVQGGRILHVEVRDHLLIEPREYLSMAESGLMPS